MEAAAVKKRSANFTVQECMLLTELMGEVHPDFIDQKLSCHKVDKHRFNSRISSSTKKTMWKTLEGRFNSSASMPREASVLQKKWDNLVAKHRNLYGDYRRAISLTGRGPPAMPRPSVLTEAVMSVVGKDSASVVGATGASFDSTFIMNKHIGTTDDSTLDTIDTFTLESIFGEESSVSDPVQTNARIAPAQSKTDVKCCCCTCADPEIKNLKKRKLELQIKFYQKKLEE